MKNLDIFLKVYRQHLALNIRSYPLSFASNALGMLDAHVGKARAELVEGVFDPDDTLIRATCAELEIPATRRSITAFIKRTTPDDDADPDD